MNTKEDKKDIKMLKNKLWKRRIFTEAEIVMFRRNQIVKNTTLLEEIQIKWYIWRKRPIFSTTRKFKNKSYRKITN